MICIIMTRPNRNRPHDVNTRKGQNGGQRTSRATSGSIAACEDPLLESQPPGGNSYTIWKDDDIPRQFIATSSEVTPKRRILPKMALIQIKHVYSIAQVYGSWFGLIHMNGSYKYDPFGKNIWGTSWWLFGKLTWQPKIQQFLELDGRPYHRWFYFFSVG